jgi:hypothetical protein
MVEVSEEVVVLVDWRGSNLPISDIDAQILK